MKNRTALQLFLMALIPLLMAGCSDNDNSPVVVIEDPDEFEQISSQSANSDPLGIDDAAALESALTALFGAANGEPIALQAGENLEAIIKRAGGS
jgi:L-alanine-DL-glutamate epimerase-like enolase superfamily enzyme